MLRATSPDRSWCYSSIVAVTVRIRHLKQFMRLMSIEMVVEISPEIRADAKILLVDKAPEEQEVKGPTKIYGRVGLAFLLFGFSNF
jgi:hypothetical protein